MNLVWAILVSFAATAFGVGALLLVRRRAPDGGYFADGDRAAGFFGVLSTTFAIMVGFVVFLAFESFDQSRTGAETEAVILTQQFETAQFFPAAVRPALEGQLVCYGRAVVGQEWPRMENGTQGTAVNPWGVALFHTLTRADPRTAKEQSAFDKWLDQTFGREESRSDRIHGAEGVIPGPLWLVIFFMVVVMFVFVLFFADSGERAVVQAVQVGSLAIVVVAILFVIRFLDTPFHSGYGGLRPVAMERALMILENQRQIVGSEGPLPCTEDGRPT